MDSKQIEKTLQNEMDDLLGAVKTALKIGDNSFVKEKSFRNNPETGKLEGYTSAKFLIDPKQEETINAIIADFEEFYKEELFVKYEPNELSDNLEKVIRDSRDKDLKLRYTTAGPHKDDLGFYVNNIDIRKFGSQGQQRTSALSLKLSEIELVKKIINDTPVLLLDDVLSELDSSRQNHLLNSLNNIQTLITCTGVDEFVKNRFNINKTFKVINGKIS